MKKNEQSRMTALVANWCRICQYLTRITGVSESDIEHLTKGCAEEASGRKKAYVRRRGTAGEGEEYGMQWMRALIGRRAEKAHEISVSLLAYLDEVIAAGGAVSEASQEAILDMIPAVFAKGSEQVREYERSKGNTDMLCAVGTRIWLAEKAGGKDSVGYFAEVISAKRVKGGDRSTNGQVLFVTQGPQTGTWTTIKYLQKLHSVLFGAVDRPKKWATADFYFFDGTMGSVESDMAITLTLGEMRWVGDAEYIYDGHVSASSYMSEKYKLLPMPIIHRAGGGEWRNNIDISRAVSDKYAQIVMLKKENEDLLRELRVPEEPDIDPEEALEPAQEEPQEEERIEIWRGQVPKDLAELQKAHDMDLAAVRKLQSRDERRRRLSKDIIEIERRLDELQKQLDQKRMEEAQEEDSVVQRNWDALSGRWSSLYSCIPSIAKTADEQIEACGLIIRMNEAIKE
jgi:hypothetical protein